MSYSKKVYTFLMPPKAGLSKPRVAKVEEMPREQKNNTKSRAKPKYVVIKQMVSCRSQASIRQINNDVASFLKNHRQWID